MNTTKEHDERIAKITFASVYPHYVAKVEKKGRTVEELQQVISWLTGFSAKDLQRLIKDGVTFEEIETPLTKQVRYLDKLVDELAKGRKMEKILRTA